ncbi:MAG: hypothetical protein C4293_02150 [Nitrospiraceae bacterium]
MLNPSFPKMVSELGEFRYILPEHLATSALRQNYCTTTGPELRLQKAYTYEIWKKMNSLGLDELRWSETKVLDACCGTGFLSYHLLSVVKPLELTLVDASESELREAEKLLMAKFHQIPVKFLQMDLLRNSFEPESFDLVIGNSFLHHLYNVPLALSEFRRLLRPGGFFVTLHEPTAAAVAYESGSLRLTLRYFRYGAEYIEDLRKEDTDNAFTYGADVWLFRQQDLKNLFSDAGFEGVVINNWHILRTFAVAKMKLHLDAAKRSLARWEEGLLRVSVLGDSILNKFLPSGAFGSFSLLAQKPQSCEGK